MAPTPKLKRKRVFTWRDWFMAFYFFSMAVSLLATLHEPQTLWVYSLSVMIIGTFGCLSVLLKLKHVEAVMIVTIGVLFMARAILLLPPEQIADNSNAVDFVVDILDNRPLTDGVGAIFPLTVLAAYRQRRGAISK